MMVRSSLNRSAGASAAVRLVLVVTLIALTVFVSLPANAADWQGKTEVREGVTYVLNPAEPMNGSKTSDLEELWRLGGYSDDEDEFFGVIASVLTDDDGNVYLLDAQLNAIKVYNPDGEFLREIGREGEGPGEFRGPAGMFFTPDGKIGVTQLQPGKIVLLTKDGEPAGEHPLPKAEGGGFMLLLGAQSRGGNLVLAAATNSFAEGRFEQTRFLASIGGDGTEKARYSSDVRVIEMANAVLDDKAWDTFDRRWLVGTDGRVYSCENYENYEIKVYNQDGTLDRVVQREYAHRKRSEQELQVAQNLMDIFAKQIPNCTVQITDWTKDIESMYAREDGSVWVLNSDGSRDIEDGQIGRFDVYDADGRFVGVYTLTGEGEPRTDGYFFVKDRLYVVTDLLQAAIGMQAGGESFSIGDEEPEPMAVICYKLDGDVLTLSD